MNFNYFITIHNKESLISEVLKNVIRCAKSEGSIIYPILDGCTDNSEIIINDLILAYPRIKIVKLYENDVHELKTINRGLRSSNQYGSGFNIILQDDVLILEENLEEIIESVYNKFPSLGVVSFRHGSNLKRNILGKPQFSNAQNRYIETIFGHRPQFFNHLKEGEFIYREIAIKSPICIPFYVVRDVGIPDEEFAPWDDMEYCYRVLKFGYNNGVLGVAFKSEVNWGTTRGKKQKTAISEVQTRNYQKFQLKFGPVENLIEEREVFTLKSQIAYKGNSDIDADNLSLIRNSLFKLFQMWKCLLKGCYKECKSLLDFRKN